MVRSAAFYLTCFDEEPKIAKADFHAPPSGESVDVLDETPSIHGFSEEMREQLFEEGRAAAKAEFDEQIERERVAFAEHLDGERQRWAREEGERLGERFRIAVGELTGQLEDSLQRILEPFVVHEIREQMLASLMDRLRIALADRENPIIHLSGPMDLLEAICSKLNGHDIAISIGDIGGVDVKARVDSTSIETRLEEWIAKLRGEGDGA